MHGLEVNEESLDGKGPVFYLTTAEALANFAEKNPDVTSTVYLHGCMSENSHGPAMWSEFLIPVGNVTKVLGALEAAFTRKAGAKFRSSEGIIPSQGTCSFHLEDGRLWEPEDTLTWYSKTSSEIAADAEQAVSATEGDWDDVPIAGDSNLDEADSDTQELTTPKRTYIEQPRRIRRARSDANVGGIRQEIERFFGLPEGSVALRGPDGKSLRADALISTLRYRWE